jgi:hypothetical protein
MQGDEMVINCQISVFAIIVADIFLKMKLESVSFQDRLVILLEKRLSGVTEQGYPR